MYNERYNHIYTYNIDEDLAYARMHRIRMTSEQHAHCARVFICSRKGRYIT